MKIILGLALAASVAMVPVATAAASPELQQRHGAQNDRRDAHNNRNARHQTNNWKKWRKGERFNQRNARYYQQVDYRKYRGLRAPPRGYRWVRSDNDAILVGITSGIIASVIANAIR